MPTPEERVSIPFMMPEVKQAGLESVYEELRSLYGGHPELCFTATGTAALEFACRALSLSPNDRVLIPTHCCHLVAAGLVRAGCRVQFIEIGDDLVLRAEHVRALTSERFSAVVAVHAYGLPCDIGSLRSALSNEVKIIEDASLSFGLTQSKLAAGDIVVASLGANKPLSLQEGGLVCGRGLNANSLFERYGTARFAKELPFISPLSPHALPHLPAALLEAFSALRTRRALAETLREFLSEKKVALWSDDAGGDPSWHRFPIWFAHRKDYERARAADHHGVTQAPHEEPAYALPMFEGFSDPIRPLVRARGSLLLVKLSNRSHVLEWLSALSEEGICN